MRKQLKNFKYCMSFPTPGLFHQSGETVSLILKGHGNEAVFWGFCTNQFGMSPLHYLSSCSDFGFEFAEIFVIEKRLPDSASRGVGY